MSESKRIDWQSIEQKWIRRWEEEKLFEKWIRGVEHPREGLPARVLGLLLVLDFACAAHIRSLKC